MSGPEDRSAGGGGADDGGAEERRRGAWAKVRSGGRVQFHVVITAATVVVCVAGEALGNLIFRGGDALGARVVNAAVFGVVAGSLLAWWTWSKEDGKG